jgi:DNA-binding NarL/FixJ family response regulator
VLLVDDDSALVQTVSTLLAGDYDVVGVASEGERAVEMAGDIQPDAIVLDIDLPDADGFHTLQALERAGSRAPVVFVGTREEDELVSEAFRWGGHGYVVKSRVASDLAPAIDHVLSGRRCVPSLTSLATLANGRGHAMHLHGDVESLLDNLAALFDLALGRGDATCVISTKDVSDGLSSRLRARGWEIATHSRYRVIDVADALHQFMRGGLPDPTLLAGVAAGLDRYRLSAAQGEIPRLLLFGNIAATLNAAGNPQAAIALERLWDSLTRDLPFLTVCGYDTPALYDSGPDVWSNVCAPHRAVA